MLDSYCIRTIGDLANTDPEFVRRRLGKNGVVLWNYANGNDLSLVAKKDFVSPIKSVGHGITTVADLEKPEQVWPVFLELTQDIGHKLRVHGLSAEGVAIHIRDNTLNTRQWQTKIALPTPVSYTHLDVYKRQMVCLLRFLVCQRVRIYRRRYYSKVCRLCKRRSMVQRPRTMGSRLSLIHI